MSVSWAQLALHTWASAAAAAGDVAQVVRGGGAPGVFCSFISRTRHQVWFVREQKTVRLGRSRRCLNR